MLTFGLLLTLESVSPVMRWNECLPLPLRDGNHSREQRAIKHSVCAVKTCAISAAAVISWLYYFLLKDVCEANSMHQVCVTGWPMDLAGPALVPVTKSPQRPTGRACDGRP